MTRDAPRILKLLGCWSPTIGVIALRVSSLHGLSYWCYSSSSSLIAAKVDCRCSICRTLASSLKDGDAHSAMLLSNFGYGNFCANFYRAGGTSSWACHSCTEKYPILSSETSGYLSQPEFHGDDNFLKFVLVYCPHYPLLCRTTNRSWTVFKYPLDV